MNVLGCDLDFAFWWLLGDSARPLVPEAMQMPVLEAGTTNPLTGEGAVVAPTASFIKGRGADDASGEAGLHDVDAVAAPAKKLAVKPATGVMSILVPPIKPANPASKSMAGGSDAGQRKKRRMELDPVVAALPSFFPRPGELGPDMPEEFKAGFDGAREEMKFFCSAIRKAGLSAKLSFVVSCCPPCLVLEVVVAPGTKCGFSQEPGLVSL